MQRLPDSVSGASLHEVKALTFSASPSVFPEVAKKRETGLSKLACLSRCGAQLCYSEKAQVTQKPTQRYPMHEKNALKMLTIATFSFKRALQ